jgi:hypothetical protein
MENKSFTNVSQRVVSSYLKSLAIFSYIPAGGVDEQAQRAFHGFMTALYTRLFEQPDLFGLPILPDAFIAENESNQKDKKQEVNRLLDKPREMIAQGVDYLMLVGAQGRLDGQALVIPDYAALVKQAKIGKKFLQGMESAGLVVSSVNQTITLRNSVFQEMMPALHILAKCCAEYENGAIVTGWAAGQRCWPVGKFLFAGCDFRALQSYQPQAQDLYRYFNGLDYELVEQLHAYFSSRNYKTDIGIGGPSAWSVRYQGDRKVKATPLFQVEYEDRFARPMRMQIKCASTARIADLLPKQSQLLQDDFHRRANICRGDDCGWCKNQKTLGPTVVEYNGDFRTLCWYTTPDIRVFDDNTVELIEQYEQMHAALVPENKFRRVGGVITSHLVQLGSD